MDDNEFDNSTIYKICPKDQSLSHLFYIGATKNFYTRCGQHYYNSYNPKKKNKLYNFIRENGGIKNFTFIPLGSFNVKNRGELKSLERQYIEKFKPYLNANIPLRTIKQYKNDNKPRINFNNQRCYVRHRDKYKQKRKERYIANKEKEILRSRQYYEKNKEKIDARRKEKFTCLCGCKITKGNKKEHNKTIKHKLGLENNFNKNILFTKQKIFNL